MSIPAMTTLEFASFVRACADLRLPAHLPSYFREFLARVAEPTRPQLAEKVRAWAADDLGDVYASLRKWQSDEK